MFFSYCYMILCCWLFLMGAIGMLVMIYDKSAAICKWRRVPERCLHGLEWAGGTFGMVIALFLFQHKSAKGNYWHRSILPFLAWCALMIGVYWLSGM